MFAIIMVTLGAQQHGWSEKSRSPRTNQLSLLRTVRWSLINTHVWLTFQDIMSLYWHNPIA